VSIAVLVVVMNQMGVEDNLTVAWLMLLLSFIDSFLLYLFCRHPLYKAQKLSTNE
jgi:hypothetical protein